MKLTTDLPERQLYKGRTRLFDRDSSPLALEFYQQVYQDRFKYYADFDFQHVRLMSGRLLIPRKPRLSGFDDALLGPKFTVSGDVTVNFNDKKFALFNKQFPHLQPSTAQQLAACHQLAHAQINFNLLPTTGGLNNLKQTLSPYDRLDRFICELDLFFKERNANTKLMTNRIVTSGRALNRPYLLHFLSRFTDVADFSRQLLFIDNASLLNALITNGRQPLATEADLVRYMTLTQRYWAAKASSIEQSLADLI